MRTSFIIGAFLLAGCPKAEEATEVEEKAEAKVEEAPTALEVIQSAHDSLEKDCGKEFPEFEGLEKLEIAEADQAKADELLAKIGSMAQSCATEFTLPTEKADSCDPSCDWCPVKWYWCIYNGGACAGGDNKSCCKLGACGSKHHCEEVCKSSCGCDVPPLPADGGGGDDEG